VFEELLHPVVVAPVLEESEEEEVGVLQGAVYLDAPQASVPVPVLDTATAAAAGIGALARGIIPLLGCAVPILVFSDPAALVL
jgi:hypothetical protein